MNVQGPVRRVRDSALDGAAWDRSGGSVRVGRQEVVMALQPVFALGGPGKRLVAGGVSG
jgi:hypothetical protein